MQKALIYIIAVLIIVGAIGAAVFLFMMPKSPVGTPSTPNDSTYGGSPSGTTQVTPSSPSGTSPGASAGLTVAATTGGAIVVKDFTKSPQTATSADIPGHYFISGGIDAYATNAPYSIYYVDKDQSFNVALLKEPIADTRKAAEQELMQKLGIDQASMCRLRYFVSVPKDVNALYSVKGNLGFSFCPGATQL